MKFCSPAQNGTKEASTRCRLQLAGCWGLLLLLGLFDYLTGYEMSLLVFYSVPVGLGAWFLGRRAGIGLALAATVTWLVADSCRGAKYSRPFFYYWNSTIHFLAFLVNAVTIARIKRDLDRYHAIQRELVLSRKALRAVTALAPRCPACGRPQNLSEAQNLEMVGWMAADPDVRDLVCLECHSSFENPGQ